MAVEAARGCGFRKIGGIYLEGPRGGGFECGRLPVPLVPCVHCGQRVKFSRALQKVTPRAFLHGAGPCRATIAHIGDPDRCKVCPFDLAFQQDVGALAWVGNRFYTPATFTAEAQQLGVSKRLNQVPLWLELGKTWCFLAHQQAIVTVAGMTEIEGGDPSKPPTLIESPGIFYAFKPSRLIMVIGDDMSFEEREKLRDRGLELVVVPHDDPDHTGADVEDLDDARQEKLL